jgi:hypothetical protein
METHGLAETFAHLPAQTNNVLHLYFSDLERATDLHLATEAAIFDFFPPGFSRVNFLTDHLVGPRAHNARFQFHYEDDTRSLELNRNVVPEPLTNAQIGETWQGPGTVKLFYVRAWQTIDGGFEHQSYASAADLQQYIRRLADQLFEELRTLYPGHVFDFSCGFTVRAAEQYYDWTCTPGNPDLLQDLTIIRPVGFQPVPFPQGALTIEPQHRQPVIGEVDMLLDENNVGHGPFTIMGPLKVHVESEIEIAIHAVTSTGMLRIVEQPALSNASQVQVATGLGGARVTVELPPGQTAGNITEESLFATVHNALRALGTPVTKLAVGFGGRDGRMLRRSSYHLSFPKLARVFPKRPCLYITLDDLEEVADLPTQIFDEIRALLPQPPLYYVLNVDILNANVPGGGTVRLDTGVLYFHWSKSRSHYEIDEEDRYKMDKKLKFFREATLNTCWHGQAHLRFRYNYASLTGTGSSIYPTYSEIRAFVKQAALHFRSELEHLLGEHGDFSFTLTVNGQDGSYRWRCDPDKETMTIYRPFHVGQDEVSMDDDTYQNAHDGPFTIESNVEVEANRCALDFEIWAAPSKHDVHIVPPLSLDLDFVVVKHDESENHVFLYEGMNVGNVSCADLFWIVRHFFWVRGVALRHVYVVPDHVFDKDQKRSFWWIDRYSREAAFR